MTPTGETEFLYDQALGDRIRFVTGGSDVRCAVAFWSEDGIARAFDDASSARRAKIVCDISMGSTSAAALVALGATDRKDLRHQRDFHAKVYISDRGAVVGSANASIAALGRDGAAARLTEAGTFHPPVSAAWKAAAAWFKGVHKRASQVDDDALEWARRAYRPPRPPASRPPRTGSLLDAVRLNPERFAGVGFVFTSRASSTDDIAAAKRSAKRLGGPVAAKEIDGWPRGGFFTNWKEAEVAAWPTLFFEFWQPARSLTVFAKTVDIHDTKNRSILSRNSWQAARARYGADLPTRAEIARADAATSARILNGAEGILFLDTQALADRLTELEGGGAAVPAGATA